MRQSTAGAVSLAAMLVLVLAFTAAAQPASGAPGPGMDREAMRAMMKTDAQLQAMVEAEGFTAVTITETGRRTIELTARDADGRQVELEVARIGAIVELEVEDDRPGQTADLMRLLPLPVREAARTAGIVDLRAFDRSRRGFELEGRDAAGARVQARFGHEGAAQGRWGHHHGDRAALDPAAVRRVVEQAGYTIRGDVEFRRAHASVIVANPEGEVVELHIERGGEIVREQRRLDLD